MSNRLLLLGLAVEIGILLLVAFSPLGHRLFGTQAFTAEVWPWIALLALTFGALEEVRKFLVRRLGRM